MPELRRVAIFYPGEMGAALGRALAGRGFELRTHVAERSARTRQNAAETGFLVCDELEGALAKAQLIVSLVPPGEAVNLARRIAAALAAAGPAQPLYLDANSVSPATVRSVRDVVEAAGARCVDGVFHGLARMLGEKAVLLLSGPQAETVAGAFGTCFPVRVVGAEVGTASSIKMCLGAFTKGLIALFLETVAASSASGRHEDLLTCLDEFYPETMAVVERLLPTYPLHVERRIQEMAEACAWHEEIGTSSEVTSGAIAALRRFAAAGLEGERAWDFDAVLSEVAQRRIFSTRRQPLAARRVGGRAAVLRKSPKTAK